MNNEEMIVIYASLQNQFLKPRIFDENNSSEFKEMLGEGKKIGKTEDVVMTEYILQDKNRINNTIAIIKENLYIMIDNEEIQIIDTFPKAVRKIILSVCQKVLTKKEKQVYDMLKEGGFTKTQTEIAKKLGVSRQYVSKTIKEIKKKGYYIPDIKKAEVKLSEQEQNVLTIISKHNGDITYTELSNLSGVYSPNVLAGLREKGYNNIEVFNATKLSKQQEMLLKVNEESEYQIKWDKTRELGISDATAKQLVKKFASTILPQEDTRRVAKFIKYRNKLPMLLKIVRQLDKVSCSNITILLDELFKDEEDLHQVINFVIEYEEVLLEKGLKGVEQPMYQLLFKYKAQLNKEQAIKLLALMNTYEEKIKQDNNDTADLPKKLPINKGTSELEL